VHMIKAQMDASSIVAVLCRKAEDLGATALIMNTLNKSKMTELSLGSLCSYCMHHSKVPVVVHRG